MLSTGNGKLRLQYNQLTLCAQGTLSKTTIQRSCSFVIQRSLCARKCAAYAHPKTSVRSRHSKQQSFPKKLELCSSAQPMRQQVRSLCTPTLCAQRIFLTQRSLCASKCAAYAHQAADMRCSITQRAGAASKHCTYALRIRTFGAFAIRAL